MGISDWVALAIAALGLAMTGLGQRTVRTTGCAVLVLAIVGGVYAHFHPKAEAQGGEANCNNDAPNGTIIGSCNNMTIVSPHESNGLYQGDTKVGKAKGASINGKVANFDVLSFDEYPDLNKPLQYGKLLLSCPNLPHQRPDALVVNLHATNVGVECQVVGEAN
jgi:hypothetical protein